MVSFRSFVVSDCTVKSYILFEWTFREKGKISFFFIILSSFANISYWRAPPPTVYFDFHAEDQLTSGLGHCAELCVLLHLPVCFNVRRIVLWGQYPSHIYWNRRVLPPPPLLCLFVVFRGFIPIPGVFFCLHKVHPCSFWRGLYWICKLLWVLTIAVITIFPGLEHRNFISVCLL